MKKRIISAIFLILIAIPLIMEGNKAFAVAIAGIGILGLKEIADLKKSHHKLPLIMLLIFSLVFLFITFISPFEYSNLIGINYRMLSFMLFLFLIPTLFFGEKENYSSSDAFYFLGVVLFLGMACHSIIMIRAKSLWLFLYIILIPILTDTFAYIFGRLIGQHKIAPKISPNKTVEGCVMGTICSTIIASAFYYILIGPMNLVHLFSVTILFSIVGQLGDLFFSKIKRENEVKDFSDLIPGHGGILDRFDSIIFVSIAFLLLIRFL